MSFYICVFNARCVIVMSYYGGSESMNSADDMYSSKVCTWPGQLLNFSFMPCVVFLLRYLLSVELFNFTAKLNHLLKNSINF